MSVTLWKMLIQYRYRKQLRKENYDTNAYLATRSGACLCRDNAAGTMPHTQSTKHIFWKFQPYKEVYKVQIDVLNEYTLLDF